MKWHTKALAQLSINLPWSGAGKLVKACYGTTKYCNAFLKGLPCNNAECLYLHDVGEPPDQLHLKCLSSKAYEKDHLVPANLWPSRSLLCPTTSLNAVAHQKITVGEAGLSAAVEEDSYTKEETKSTKFVNLVHAASLNQASAVASGQPHATTLAELNAAFPNFEGSQNLTEPLSSLDEEASEGAGWPTLSKAWSGKGPPAPTTQQVRVVLGT